MYNVLIVDDFAIDRSSMVEAIQSFEELPLHVVGACENGYDALELIHNVGADILICDVEMPGMSGIELANLLRQENFTGRIVFCSLYDKLHYLKAAFAVNSDGYLTKPFSRGELESCIKRILMQFMDIEKQQKQLEALRENMMANQLKLTREFFTDLLLCYDLSREEVERRKQQMGITPELRFRVAVIEVNLGLALTKELMSDDTAVIPYRVYQTLKMDTGWQMPYYAVRINERYYTVVFRYHAEDDVTETRHRTEQALAAFVQQMRDSGIMVVATFGRQISDVMEVRKQYERCRQLLNHKQDYDGDTVIFAEDDLQESSAMPVNDPGVVQSELRALLECEPDKLEHAVADYVDSRMSGMPLMLMQMLCHYTLGCIQFMLQQDGLSGYQENELIAQMNRVMSLTGEQACLDYMYGLILHAYEQLHQQGADKYDELIERIRKYIRESDLKVIHLGMIADHFSYSPNYLNHIFKEGTGDTILDYVTKCRINRAKKLMRETNMHLADIAMEIGYSHATYMSIVFKRLEGMTPKAYMEKNR